MKLLLDTHIFLWLNQEPEKLPKHLLTLCSDRQNKLFLSMVSPWEIQIKSQLGKLHLHAPLHEMISYQQSQNDLNILSIQLEHINTLATLANYHNDPFDRLLIAQSIVESMILVTVDTKIKQYQIQVASD